MQYPVVPIFRVLLDSCLRVEERHERFRVGCVRCRVQRLRQRHHDVASCRVGEVGAGRNDRRVLLAVERIHDENGVTRFRQPLADLPELRPQAKDVRPHDHAWIAAARWMDEVAVCLSVRSLDSNLGLGDVERVRRAW